MANSNPFPRPVLFWGTTGVMTQAVLARLLAARVPLAGLVIPGGDTPAPRRVLPPAPVQDELPMLDAFFQPTAVHQAWSHDLPVYAVGRLTLPDVAAWLADQAPAAVVVACFPRRIPTTLLAIPRLGFLNVHPSRLPAYRGPTPLFWQLRDDVQPLGVTVHFMDAELDTGGIAGQADVPRPDGATGPQLDAMLGAAGGDLLAAVLAAGASTHTAQPRGGSYQGWPTDADFILDPTWSARHAYNFMRGTEEWGRPYCMGTTGERWRVDHALGWEADAVLDRPVVCQDGILHIQFSPGVVFASGALLR